MFKIRYGHHPARAVIGEPECAFMPRRLCFELNFCTRNSVAQKEGQYFSDLALLARAEHARVPPC